MKMHGSNKISWTHKVKLFNDTDWVKLWIKIEQENLSKKEIDSEIEV